MNIQRPSTRIIDENGLIVTSYQFILTTSQLDIDENRMIRLSRALRDWSQVVSHMIVAVRHFQGGKPINKFTHSSRHFFLNSFRLSRSA